jgi:hypothetical protein
MEKKFLIASIQSLNIWDFVISISYDFVVLSSNVMNLDTVYTSTKGTLTEAQQSDLLMQSS